MKKNKLFELLGQFTPTEFENFGIFLESPYLNKSENAKTLFRIITTSYPDFENKKVEKEIIFEKIYPGEKYKDKKLRDLYSLTLELAEDYLALLKIRNDRLLLKKNSLSQLAKKGLAKHFEQKAREMETILKNNKVKKSSYFYYQFSLLKEKREYYQAKENLGKRKRFFTDVDEEIDMFILYFVSNMLIYYLEILNNQKSVKHDAKFEMLDEILNYLKTKNIANYPYILLHYNTLLLSKYPEKTQIFHELRKMLNQENEGIDDETLMSVFIDIYNYSKERALKGDSYFTEENYKFLKEMIAKNIYPVEDGYMSDQIYLTTLGEGLINKDFEWTRNFIESFKDKITPEKKDNAYKYGLAIYHYRLKNYGKALDLLSKVKAIDFFYKLRIMNNKIKIFFEISEYDAALNDIDSFRHYLTSNKVMPDYLKNRFLGYVNFLGRIINAVLGNDLSNLKKIEKEIFATPVIENRTWMLENIESLLSKNKK